MADPQYLEVFAADKSRALTIAMRMETDRYRGFHDDERMIAWSYDPTGALFQIQDTEVGKIIYPPRTVDPELVEAWKHSTVYFIQAASGPIKIGVARDVSVRIKTLRCGNHEVLTLLATTEGGRAAERAYHKRFAEFRLHYEWFHPAPEILAEIARLTPARQENV